MPYIKQSRRKDIIPLIVVLHEELKTKGEYNFAITYLLHLYVLERDLCYDTLNDAEGIIDCAADEFYNKVIVPYEAIKRKENGNISELDKEVE